jgi:hypothetical protein
LNLCRGIDKELIESKASPLAAAPPIFLIACQVNLRRCIDGLLSKLVKHGISANQAYTAQRGGGGGTQPVRLLTCQDECGTSRIRLFKVPAIVLTSAEIGKSGSEGAVGGCSLLPELLVLCEPHGPPLR